MSACPMAARHHRGPASRAWPVAAVLALLAADFGADRVGGDDGVGGSAPGRPTRETVRFESAAVGRTMAYDVLLPAGYATSGARYPVLYLLHGFGGHHRVWDLLGGPATDPAWPRDLLVVMPDAGNGWYVNWQASEGPGPERWEDYIAVDLIDHVDRTWRTIPERAGRAIGGFSMGGYGALVLALRQPDRFAAAVSISGFLDYARSARKALERGPIAAPRRRQRPAALEHALVRAATRPDPAIALPGFSSREERTPAGRPFATAEAAQRHDPFALVLDLPRARLPRLYLACGTEDSLHPFSRELAEALLAHRIPFGYWQADGGHDASFRARALTRLVPRLGEDMQRALRASDRRPDAVTAPGTPAGADGDRSTEEKTP